MIRRIVLSIIVVYAFASAVSVLTYVRDGHRWSFMLGALFVWTLKLLDIAPDRAQPTDTRKET